MKRRRFHRGRLSAFTVAVMSWACGLASAQWQSIPVGGESLLPALPVADLFSLGGSQSGSATEEVKTVAGMPFTESYAATTTQVGATAWDVQIGADTIGDIAAGDVLLMAFFARGDSTLEGGEVSANAHLQKNSGDYTKIITSPINSGTDWRQFLVPVKAVAAHPDGGHNFRLHIAAAIQTVEIGGLEIINYHGTRTVNELPRTEVTYDGRAPDSPWRALAQQRIEQHRKGDIDITVVDADGQPVPNAQVRVRMKRHAFGFGAAFQGKTIGATEAEYLALPAGSQTGSSYQDLVTFRQVFEQSFNKAVMENDLKWGGWLQGADNTHNSYRREWVDRTLQWAADREIEARGHWISWGPADPDKPWILGFPTTPDPLEKLDQRLMEHMDEKVPVVGTRVGEWDVINHIVGWGKTLETLYGTQFYEQIIERSRQLNPAAELWVNEGRILPGGSRVAAYKAVIQHLINAGHPPDGIGFMGHFSIGSLTGMNTLYQRLEEFAALLPNLQVTEFDIDVEPAYEQLQADYFRDFLTLAFSHPDMQAVMQWGFWEGKHWRPDAALWRSDWSIKPVGQAYLDLVFGDWWTDEALTADEDGEVSTRGFRGEYEITVTGSGYEQSFDAVVSSGGVVETLAFVAPQAMPECTGMSDIWSAGPLSFHFDGLAGSTYELQASDELGDSALWEVVDAVVLGNGSGTLTDPNAGSHTRRFYRIRWAP